MNLQAIGHVRSPLHERTGAPRQPWEGAPPVRIDIDPRFREALEGIEPGQEIWVLTWLHQADRSTMKVRPRGCITADLTGVFNTRSPDRPNPIGLHRTRITNTGELWIEIANLEAINGTPVIDLKPILDQESSSA